ncbi:MAG TPA: PTS sugar transporter subunit IIA, partial [Candidatus Acidoferrum sp.]|nr:PTS sugar transporter subunit IIA [Candidatus Acidoferrum sp.]
MAAADGERLLTLAELANYLHMGQKTVLRLAEAKQIPGRLIDREWRFRRAAIDGWLASQTEDEGQRFEDVPDGMHLPLGDLLPESAIIHDMRARDPLGAIEELAARAYASKWLNDKPWFVGAVVEREVLASTAMEGGVAFLHTRAREADRISRPFIVVGRTYDGIEFGAPDGKPTYLFFLLGLKCDRLHLPLL